jgi:DNA polymerase III subunit beta
VEFRIAVAELAKAVSLAQGIVQRKNAQPILSHVLLDASPDVEGNGRLTLIATDLDINLRTHRACEITTPGQVTIPARALADMVRVLPGPDVSLKRLPNGHVEVKSGRTKARLMALPSDEFPSLPNYEQAAFVRVDQTLLTDMIDRTLYASSQDDTRFNLNGVYFEPPTAAEQPLTMVATDGHRLARIERTIEGAHTFKLRTPVILPRKGLSELRRVIDSENTGGTLELGFQDNQAAVRVGATTIGMRLVDGQFPDYRQVIPKLADKIVRVTRADLLDSLKRVSVLAQDKASAVKLQISKDQLVIHCNNPETGEITDDIPVEYNGNNLEVAFNARYLLEALSSLADQNVLLKLTDHLSPGLLLGADETRHLCVVMPMRL